MADTVESIADGTMNTSPINFSTMPTAAASISPRWLAMTVMARNEICMNPSCMAIGTPIFRMCLMTSFCGRKSERDMSITPRWRRIDVMAKSTLVICDKVVPMAVIASSLSLFLGIAYILRNMYLCSLIQDNNNDYEYTK